MGTVSIACYRPKPGSESDLLQVVREHVPTLQRLEFATDRASLVLRSSDGTLVEIFEWAGAEAKGRAHVHETVRALWDRFSACAEMVTLRDLGEAGERFANLEPVEL